MPVNVQSQIAAQLAFIQQTLQADVQGATFGDVSIASNLQDLWNQSFQTSARPMAYVCYAGETPWSSSDSIAAITHRVSRDWIVRVKQGRGYQADRGNIVLDFIAKVEHIRDVIRAMLGISEDAGIDGVKIRPVRLGDQVIDCYDIMFQTKNDLPAITLTPDQSPI